MEQSGGYVDKAIDVDARLQAELLRTSSTVIREAAKTGMLRVNQECMISRPAESVWANRPEGESMTEVIVKDGNPILLLNHLRLVRSRD